eukprot:TRINITY_DN13339_c0_g1_i1.p1 TRINITY_DN13339_c0_g1~~TRINITY_DN13339_c0_g1_i1.p1  ORF type:complete len:432 (-),score=116.49 TRINITY_DN13339_c0_g1_i1:605-1900(-)
MTAPSGIDADIAAAAFAMSEEELRQNIKLVEQQCHIFRGNLAQLDSAIAKMEDEKREKEKHLKMNMRRPWVIGHIAEILDAKDCALGASSESAAGSAFKAHSLPSDKCYVIKSTTREVRFLNSCGLLTDAEKLKPSDLVGCAKESFMLVSPLPPEFDSRVRAMEVDEKLDPKKYTFNELGGLSKQVEQIIEAVILPIQRASLFKNIGIQPPNGVLMYGEPGTGKTALARVCAAQADCMFLKLAGTNLVQMYIGDGARIVRNAFEKAALTPPAIIFIDELDAVGTRRFADDSHGDREVQRTMLELLNHMDGFSSKRDVKVIAATNRVDVLDPALLRSGRFDRKIEFPLPDVQARSEILRIHSRRIPRVEGDVQFDELALATEGFNGAMLRGVCMEAAMTAMRADKTKVSHEHYMEGIAVVQAKKKLKVNYYA